MFGRFRSTTNQSPSSPGSSPGSSPNPTTTRSNSGNSGEGSPSSKAKQATASLSFLSRDRSSSTPAASTSSSSSSSSYLLASQAQSGLLSSFPSLPGSASASGSTNSLPSVGDADSSSSGTPFPTRTPAQEAGNTAGAGPTDAASVPAKQADIEADKANLSHSQYLLPAAARSHSDSLTSNDELSLFQQQPSLSPNASRRFAKDHPLLAKSKSLREHAKALQSSLLEWESPPNTVFIIKKFRDKNVTERLKDIATWLITERKLTVYVEASVLQDEQLTGDEVFAAAILPKLLSLDPFLAGSLAEEIDFIICLGGDGTILYASSLFQARCPPVMSFHMGSLGFLMPFDVRHFKEKIDSVLLGKCLVTMRMRLECEILRGKNNTRASLTTSTFHALNEIVIDRGPSPFLGDLQVLCDSKMITSVQGDGLIVATPTGSTAYSVSAGGSMVHPNVPAILLTPICPHTLSFRPILVPDTVELRLVVSLTSRNSAWISLDGRNPQELQQGDGLRIVSSPWPVPTINRIDQSSDWFRSLSRCLNWNVRQKQLPFDDDTTKYRPHLGPNHGPHFRSPYDQDGTLDEEEESAAWRRFSSYQ